MSTKKVLFLCTGNYYRSRFAEILFNHLCEKRGLPWVADSRGLDFSRSHGNVGPISPLAAQGLAERKIALPVNLRFPILAVEADLRDCDLVVAMKEAEHRPLLLAAHPAMAAQVEYWHIHDLDQSSPREALEQIEREIGRLLDRLPAR